MALFGKKKADVSDEAVVAAPAGQMTAEDGEFVAEQDAAPKGRKVKPPKATKTAKSNGVKSGTIVGLNIGNAFIKAVEVTSKGGQLSVTGIGVVETPPDSYANGNVLNVSSLSNALRTLWKAANLHTKATILSVAGTGSLVVRVIEVPRMTDGELTDNMRVDADRYIPFPPSEVVMDFKALRDLPSDPDAANMEVLLAAAQREIIDLHVSVVQKAKLDPRAIDVEPIALARAVQLENSASDQFVDYDEVSAVLNIGETGTEISILRGDIVVFTRTVPNGGGNLTNAIAETMSLPRVAAERLKIEEGDALPPAGYSDGMAQEDDFGFGDFGEPSAIDAADDINFDAAPQSPQSAPPATPSASDDPFDLDFFDQGGQRSEPGAGHGQKEDDEDETPRSGGIKFSFGKLDDDLTPSHASDAPSPAPAQPQSAPVPPSAPSLENFDLPDSYLPSTNANIEPPAAPTASIAAAQSPAPKSGSAMPSAFDFSDFDLPTVESKASSATAPTQKLEGDEEPSPPATPVAPASFGFSDEPPAIQSAPAEPLETEVSTEAPVEVETEAAPVTEEDAFDLDDLFGAPAAGTESAPTVSAGAVPVEGGFDTSDLDFGGVAASDNDFDVSALGMDGGDDFASFGTGLSQTGDTDANTLYQAMQPVLDDLATEVRRSLEFHLGRYPDTTFSRLILMGGGAKLRNLDAFLYQNLGVPTVIGNPFAYIETGTLNLPSEFVPTNAPLCAVALGLALRDFIE